VNSSDEAFTGCKVQCSMGMWCTCRPPESLRTPREYPKPARASGLESLSKTCMWGSGRTWCSLQNRSKASAKASPPRPAPATAMFLPACTNNSDNGAVNHWCRNLHCWGAVATYFEAFNKPTDTDVPLKSCCGQDQDCSLSATRINKRLASCRVAYLLRGDRCPNSPFCTASASFKPIGCQLLAKFLVLDCNFYVI